VYIEEGKKRFGEENVHLEGRLYVVVMRGELKRKKVAQCC